MKQKTSIIRTLTALLLLSSLISLSCTKKFDKINTDRNAIATVGSSELPFLFAKAEGICNAQYLELPDCTKSFC